MIVSSLIQSVQNFAARSPECVNGNFFSFPTWYQYLDVTYSETTKKCEVVFELMKDGQFNGDAALLVGLAVIDILIRAAALVAVGFVMYGGIRYITSQGSPDGTKQAQNTIINALAGLAIAVVAAGAVAFVGGAVT